MSKFYKCIHVDVRLNLILLGNTPIHQFICFREKTGKEKIKY